MDICIYNIRPICTWTRRPDTYPLRLGGHADELLGRIATVSIGDRMHSLLGLQLLDEIALQAYGAITIVHLTLCEGETGRRRVDPRSVNVSSLLWSEP